MTINLNQNIISLLIQRNLSRVGERLQSSFEKISSGERINRSSDDPAGLALSQSVRYEIRGFQRNERNVSGALSMLGTSESGMSGIQSVLQKIRELLVQAANETLSNVNREAITIEVTALLEEIDRIASDTRFLGKRLLDGSVVAQTIQVGTGTGQKLGLTIRDLRIAALGEVATDTSNLAPTTAAIAGGGDLQINGVDIPATSSDGTSQFFSDGSAIAKARAINSVQGQTKVRAKAEANEYLVPGATVTGGFLDTAVNSLTINGISIGPVTVLAGDSDGSLVAAINARTIATGVTANVEPSGELKLTAADGRNITITTTGNFADNLGLLGADGDLTALTQTARITLSSDEIFGVGGADPALIGFDGAQLSVGFDATTAISNVSVSSAADASNGIELIEAAIRQLGGGRAQLGALQNRLEAVTDTLARRIEELSKTDSRIRDTDFALETARLSQAQILQEASLALLAQANIAPRTALMLLQR